MTDFENAAFSVFIVLLTRAIISFDLNFYMPISKVCPDPDKQKTAADVEVDENMQKAQERDGAQRNEYFFRKNIFPLDRPRSNYNMTSRPQSPPGRPLSHRSSQSNFASSSRRQSFGDRTPVTPVSTNGHSHARDSSCASTRCPSPQEEEEAYTDECAAMTIDEVINGKGESFPGLMGVVNAYLNSLNVDVGTKCELRRYLDIIKMRAKGPSQRDSHYGIITDSQGSSSLRQRGSGTSSSRIRRTNTTRWSRRKSITIWPKLLTKCGLSNMNYRPVLS